VLLAGGTTSTTSAFASATTSAEIFDPVTGTWTPTGSMHVTRTGKPEAVVLADGRILIAGGGSNVLTNTAEIYDPGTGPVHADRVHERSPQRNGNPPGRRHRASCRRPGAGERRSL